MKKIKIGEKEYDVSFSAFTYLLYRKVFDMNIFDDISVISKYFAKQLQISEELKKGKIETDISFDEIENFLISVSRICYIAIYSAKDENFISYEDFMKEVPKLTVDEEWVFEVTGLAVEKFC